MRDQTYRHPADEEVTLNENAFVDLLACSGGCDFAADRGSYCESANAADFGCVSAIGPAFDVSLADSEATTPGAFSSDLEAVSPHLLTFEFV